MSVEATTWALRQQALKSTQKLLLIGLANHATPEGEHARPAVTTLAAYASVTERNARSGLRKLEADGWIERTGVYYVNGRKDRAVYIYRLLYERGDAFVLPWEPRGDAGVIHGGTPASPEPSLERHPSESVDSEGTRVVEDDDDRRARGLVRWYVQVLTERRGQPPKVTKSWEPAARKIVRDRSGDEIRALVVWALSKNAYNAGRASTLPKLAQHYAELRLGWQADLSALERSAAITRERSAREQERQGPAAATNTCLLHDKLVRYSGARCPECEREEAQA